MPGERWDGQTPAGEGTSHQSCCQTRETSVGRGALAPSAAEGCASPSARVPRPPQSPAGAPRKSAAINRAQPSSGGWRRMRMRKQMGAGGRGCP